MERSYRIKANVGEDQVLNVNLRRDVDFYEVLSLKLEQEKLYKLHSSNYGVIVGRVLANDGFGVPNAKVSVFLKLNREDKTRSDIKELYSYASVTSFDKNNVRYNLLPKYSTKECHVPVGTIPSKREVLDEDVRVEIQDKYYRYSTVTNNAGDYMIFGVPVGKQTIHVDIDLSDIGVLSQRPTDMIYKGYSLDLFESPVEFKKSTNLYELAQIISEDSAVNVYPFWGDESENEIAITRKDIRIQYKFEPTCVFLGSVMTDSSVNSVDHECTPDEKTGEASQLVASEGTIEMIRKNVDDTVEEFKIKGNQLIDGSGVFCYQIPMNLDFVCTDEYGNIVPTDNPNKGIPTRARVRFRFTLSETGDETVSSHKARYLVPNNPELLNSTTEPYVKKDVFNEETSHYYEFGTLTNPECFRDLLWNKVYTVKSYIPRVQRPTDENGEKSKEFVGIKGVNKSGTYDMNPLPYNKLNLNLSMSYYDAIRRVWEELDEDPSFVRFWYFLNGKTEKVNYDAVYEKMAEEMDGIGLDFYNDWLNGCLYFPNWNWHVEKKQAYAGGRARYESTFCDCDKNDDDRKKLCVLNNCSLPYENDEMVIENDYTDEVKCGYAFQKITYGSKQFEGGIIKKVTNKDGADVFYYVFGQNINDEELPSGGIDYLPYVRLFSTDIVLLGSLNDCDIHGIPKISYAYPNTTSTIPPMGRYKYSSEDEEHDDMEDNVPANQVGNAVNGMNWGCRWKGSNGHDLCKEWESSAYNCDRRTQGIATGLFFGLTKVNLIEWESGICNDEYPFTNWKTKLSFMGLLRIISKNHSTHAIMPLTDYKSCINAERICELGVTNDMTVNDKFTVNDQEKNAQVPMDGAITRREIQDVDTRALFATLNSNPLLVQSETDATGYKSYNMYYMYPCNFDGRLERFAERNSDRTKSKDIRNKDYLDFRLGSISNDVKAYEKYTYGITRMGGMRPSVYNMIKKPVTYNKLINIFSKQRHFYGCDEFKYSFPLYENSFYFYFGLDPAHTAIGEFYKNFTSVCKQGSEKVPFSMTYSVKSATWCPDEPDGEITVYVNGASYPYDVYVTLGGEEVATYLGNQSNKVTITGLSNDSRYTVTVVDADGESAFEMVYLMQSQIQLKYSMLQNAGRNARINVTGYTNNNVYYTVSSFSNIDYSEPPESTYHSVCDGASAENKITLNLDSDGEILLTIYPPEGEAICNGGTPDDPNQCFDYVDGSVIGFKKPGTYTYEIEQVGCDDNYSTGSFVIE